jgi:hypothetical protein
VGSGTQGARAKITRDARHSGLPQDLMAKRVSRRVGELVSEQAGGHVETSGGAVELGVYGRRVGLVEDGADLGGQVGLGGFEHSGQQIAHVVQFYADLRICRPLV